VFAFGHLSEMATAGVDVFFIISGFVIGLTGPLATSRPGGIQFFWRRWSRVAPLFYLLSVPAVLVSLGGDPLNWNRIIGTVFFWPATGPRILPPYLPVGWTLCFEMIFYATVALLLIGGRLWRNLAVLAATAAGLALLRPAPAWLGWHMLTNPIFLEFGFGMYLAVMWRRFRLRSTVAGALLILLALSIYWFEATNGVGDAWTMDATLYDTEAMRRVVILGTPAALLVTGALLCEDAFKGALARALAKAGEASYSLYLAHGLLMLILFHAWQLIAPIRPAPWLAFWTTLPFAFISGFFVYWAVERPLIGRMRQWRTLSHDAGGQVRRPKRADAGDLASVVDDLVG
jgi:peptidoglycan/LPS O-acetylase OafA/YrhL